MKKLKILFIGESTDDHIFVIREVIEEIDKIIEKRENVEFRVIYISSSTKNFEIKIKTKADIKTKTIYSSVFLFPLSFIQSFFYLFIDTPDLIFTKGGHVSLPVIISAQILRIPIFLHTTNSTLLSVNKFIAKNALTVFTSFNNTKGLEKKKELRLGYPVNQELLNGHLLDQKDFFIFSKEKRPTLFFISKLRNSEKINDFILSVLNELTQKFYIFHETTKEEYDQTKNESRAILNDNNGKFYHVFHSPTLDKSRNIYMASDMIISEFNENIMFQISSMQKPSILIIFSSGVNDFKERRKVENAYFYENIGAGIIIEEANLKRGLFLSKLDNLFEEAEENIKDLKKMSKKAKEFSTPNAGKLIATYLFEYWKFRIQ